MIIDTSAIMAVLLEEPEGVRFSDLIAQSGGCFLSAANYFELFMVVEAQFGPAAAKKCEALLRTSRIHVEPVTEAHANHARLAFVRFGKGRHPAGLNFGDCFSYALAKAKSDTLLFKGNDFARTDIPPAA